MTIREKHLTEHGRSLSAVSWFGVQTFDVSILSISLNHLYSSGMISNLAPQPRLLLTRLL